MVSSRNLDLEEIRMSRKVRSTLALLVLTLFLGTGAAHALPKEAPAADRGPGMLVAAWDWLTSLLEGKAPFLPSYEAVGTVQTPQPGTNTSNGSNGDYGGYIDPNG